MARTSAFALFLVSLCLALPALAADPLAAPRATKQQVQQTVDRAIDYLRTESASWLGTRKCAACHHMQLPLWALSEADRQGYAIDKKFVAETAEAALGSEEKLIASRLVPGPNDKPDTRPLARGVNMGLVFLAVAAQSLPSLEKGQKQSLVRIGDEIVKKQQADGSWEFFLSRPPINECQTTDSAWMILALQGENKKGSETPEAHRAALQKGVAWLAAVKPAEKLQERVLQLLVALRTGKTAKETQGAIDELVALQQKDGGWSQLPNTPSDAFATGQTLYVLALAGYTAQRPDIQRAIDFLVATQKPDGSWPMTSRSRPDGSEGGSATLLTPIICGASSWATLGLVRMEPKRP